MVAMRLETRAMILQAFEDIPETFANAVDAALRFPSKTYIRDAVVQLGHTLAENVAELIRVLLRTNHPQKNKCKYFPEFPVHGRRNPAVGSNISGQSPEYGTSARARSLRRCATVSLTSTEP